MGLSNIAPVGLSRLELEILERMDESVVVCDDAARLLYCNPAAERALGLSSRDVSARDMWEAWPADEAFRRAFRRVVATGATENVELHIDQPARSFETKIFPVARGVCIVARDVTDSRRLAAEMRAKARRAESERDRLTTLFAALPAAVSVHEGPAHLIVFANSALGRQIGETDLVGKSAADVWNRPQHGFIVRELDGVYRDGEPVLRTAVPVLRRVSADTFEERYVTYSLTPFRDADDRVVGVVRFAIDVTEEVLDRVALEKLQGALHVQADRYRLVNRATSDALWDLDVPTGRVEWNEALSAQFGYGEHEVDPTIAWWLAHVHPDDRERAERSLRDALDTPLATSSAEYRFARKDGTYADVLDRRFVLRDEAGTAERVVGSIMDLSERKRLERALLESETRLRASLSAANIGTWRVDLRSGVDVRDGTLNAIFGLGASDTVTPIEDFIDRVHPQDRSEVVSAIDRAVRERGSYEITFRIVRPDGTIRWVHDVGRVLCDDHGAFAMTGAVVDVTETRRAEEALRASELRYRSLVLATNHVVWTTDALGHVEGPQPLWCAFTGQRLEAAHGAGWLDAVHPDDREMVRATWDDSIARRRVHQAEFRVRRHDGAYRHVIARAAPVLTDEGRVREWIATAVDATEKKMLAAELEAVFDGSPIGMAVVDRKHRFVRLNRAMAELTGLPLDEYRGCTVHEVVPAIREPLERFHRKVLETGEAHMGTELTLPARSGQDGARHFLAGFYPVVVDGEVTATVGIALEITAHRREQARVEEANRAKDEFLAVVSHELRTPLNAVLGWSRMLMSDSLSAEQQRRAIQTIERNARAQAQLIEDLLDISRIITGKLRIKLERVDMARVIEGAIEVVRPAATAKGVVIEADVPAPAAPIVGDADRLQQILWNLLSNAVKFTPSGGRVSIHLHEEAETSSVIVEDTGQGIAPEFIPHMFDRFRQADGGSTRPHGGLGLGLAIVRHLAELHGGTVEAESEGPGRGTRLLLKLPVAPRDVSLPLPFTRPEAELSPPPTSVRPRTPRPSLRGIRVLVVDDEPDARELMESILVGSGADVRTASSAAEAMAELLREAPDVLVSDIAMPGEDGYALIAQVRALAAASGGRTPAIALTAYARIEDKKRAEASGFDTHMSKPVEASLLLSTIASLSAREPARAE